ncbi:MAG: MBL fold metallo-hydrolase, partial [Thermodesulfobacteriota bacterium]|nr:MBL fold metallo-hydrolase [Thermodesulfobacteriota bacterium]
ILDGITIAHLGDLGTSLTEDEVSKLKGIDVILVPVGGGFTIDAKEADDLIKAVQPKVAIPMHYGSFPMIASIDDFQNLSSIPIKKKDHTVNISQSTLPSDTEVWELAISPELP